MKLKEYLELREPGAEVTCWDRDIDSEFYFYTKESGEKTLYGKDFPNVERCEELLKEHLDVVAIRNDGITVNLYELLDNPAIVKFAKEHMFEEHQYEDDSDVVMMLFDDNVSNFSNGFEGFSKLMVQCLTEVYGEDLNKGVEQVKKLFHSTDSELSKYNGTEIEIIRPLTNGECDIEDVGVMYKARFYDGYIRDVFEDELSEVSVRGREPGVVPKMKYGDMTKFLNNNGILLMQPLVADCVDTLLPIGWDGSEDDYEKLCEKCFNSYLEAGATNPDIDVWDVVKNVLDGHFEEKSDLSDLIEAARQQPVKLSDKSIDTNIQER